ncbi:MAG: GNAT family N-acetyltransferase [Deltaproteobacteria bacterium]|nr:GNAT family N-acetyltransferase [Deltaproteobacteria bacterium]
MIRYVPSVEGVNWKEVSSIFKEVNWGERDPADISMTFRKSTYTVFAYDDDRLIGFGRTLDDGKYYAVLVDVVVRPAYQKKGIGTHIVNYLKDACKGYIFVTLTSAPGKEEFYEKLGWKRQKTAYMWPKDSAQEKEHCL